MFDQIQTEIRTGAMATEMQCLLRDYPHAGWDAHPGFAEKTRNWLAAHQMFRQLARHQSDEEDLAVPIILHHRLRG